MTLELAFFIILLAAGFVWMIWSASLAPHLCYFCGADTREDVAKDRERCSSCGEPFH